MEAVEILISYLEKIDKFNPEVRKENRRGFKKGKKERKGL